MSPDLDYWRNNSYPIAFQNHHAGIIFSGDGIHINGFGTGGINGNGNTWYNAEKAVTQPGRPMPFVWWNVSDVTVKHFFVKQPPLWSINIMNGTDMWFDDIYVNATALQAPFGDNWVQNTDGFGMYGGFFSGVRSADGCRYDGCEEYSAYELRVPGWGRLYRCMKSLCITLLS
jgi:hypothetical protein